MWKCNSKEKEKVDTFHFSLENIKERWSKNMIQTEQYLETDPWFPV